MDGLLIRLRALVRNVAPILLRQGWSHDDVRSISAYIRRQRDEGNEQALRHICAWLSSKLPPMVEGVAVRPVLGAEAESRALDRAWADKGGK